MYYFILEQIVKSFPWEVVTDWRLLRPAGWSGCSIKKRREKREKRRENREKRKKKRDKRKKRREEKEKRKEMKWRKRQKIFKLFDIILTIQIYRHSNKNHSILLII